MEQRRHVIVSCGKEDEKNKESKTKYKNLQ